MGVPQGSILGPTLFNLYVTPLAKVIRSYGFDVLSYADDTQILVTLGPDPLETKSHFKDCMSHIDKWMYTNQLQLNGGKTEIMLYGRAHEHWAPDWWPASLGPCPIPTQSVRNLGFQMDNKLSMKDHINNTVGSCFGIMRNLRKVFKWLPLKARKPLVQGLIISRMDYGNALLASTNENLLSRMQVLQNTAARLVLNLPPRSPLAPNLKLLHWLPVRKLIRFKILCLTPKNMYVKGPGFWAQKLSWYQPGRTLRSSNQALLAAPRICTTTNEGRAFSFLASAYWNKMPLHLHTINDHNCFRRQLKTWLFDI